MNKRTSSCQRLKEIWQKPSDIFKIITYTSSESYSSGPSVATASVAFAHAARTHINSLQVIKSRFCRIAVRAPWYMRNVGLHDDLILAPVRKYFKEASESYFDKATRHENVGTANYLRERGGPTQSRRRLKYVLSDHPNSLFRTLKHRSPSYCRKIFVE